jgi:hypothetical protein
MKIEKVGFHQHIRFGPFTLGQVDNKECDINMHDSWAFLVLTHHKTESVLLIPMVNVNYIKVDTTDNAEDFEEKEDAEGTSE